MNEQEIWADAYIGLGSNLGDSVRTLESARQAVAALPGVEEAAFSPLYISRPVGPQDQPDYVNAVMRIRTSLPALELLHHLQAIENSHGRVRSIRWGARTLDLDILIYGQQSIDLPDLIVPHPEMTKRVFVLYPLADVAGGDLSIPGNGRLADLLAACPVEGLERMVS